MVKARDKKEWKDFMRECSKHGLMFKNRYYGRDPIDPKKKRYQGEVEYRYVQYDRLNNLLRTRIGWGERCCYYELEMHKFQFDEQEFASLIL
jgi:hypothetical protein